VRVVFSEEHRQHFPQAELYMGEFVTPFERPSRMEYVLRRLKVRGFDDIVAPGRLDMKPVRKLHDRGYLKFLQTAWDQWIAEGGRGEIIPTSFPMRRMQQRVPRNIDGKAGYYTLATETAITAGTWAAARASAAVALTAQRLVAGGEPAAFALCRPPGHHAATIDMYGGYCFLNNAGLAAQAFLDGGARADRDSRRRFPPRQRHPGHLLRPQRRAVLFAARPARGRVPLFPRLQGRGRRGAGRRLQRSITPCLQGPHYDVWGRALDDACRKIRRFGRTRLWCRWASMRSRTIRSASSSSSRRTSGPAAPVSPRASGRRCSSWRGLCHRGHRSQHGERARRLPRWLED
jgi:hypothetical protein